MAERTPSQTVGPFFHEALRWKDGGPLRAAAKGERMALIGRLVDGAGKPIADAMVEAWQQAPAGLLRMETDDDGTFRIETVTPQGTHPHLGIAIFARGLLKPLLTRVYLDEGVARADPEMQQLAASARLATLVARRDGDAYRWDVRLQGEGETVFFAA